MNNRLKYGVLALTTLIIVALGVSFLSISSARAATAYYVDCSAGSNGAGTQSSPWNNLATVNGHTFVAGDQILFKRGATCSGQLWPLGSGTSESAFITISDYGSGALPIINGGSSQSAVKLFNQQYWHIQNIETIGGNPYGIYVGGDVSATLNHFRVTNVVAHDVQGTTTSQKENGIIVFVPSAAGTLFNDVIIDGATVYNTQQWAGILVGGDDFGRLETSPRNTNITIRNSSATNVYGDAIVLYQVNTGLLENNLAYNTGLIPTDVVGTPNGIWEWECGNCIVQHNEVYQQHSPSWDGGGLDIDYGSQNNIVQYNYSHDNDTYCMSVFATGGTSQPVSDNTMRYNICSNNARVTDQTGNRQADFYVAVWKGTGGGGLITNLQVYNNTFYWNPANSAEYAIGAYDLYHNGGDGWLGCQFKNNLIYSTVPGLLNIWKVGMTFDNNLWWYNGTPSFKWVGSTYTSFAAYQSGTGQDAHGLYANPMLNDPTYHGNGFPTTSFTLQSGSPAINAGADLGNMGAHDFFGNAIPQGGVYDIGAYESGGAPLPTATNTPIPPTPTVTVTPGGPTPTRTSTPVPPTPTRTNTPGGTLMHVGDLFTADAAGNPQTVFVAGSGSVYSHALILDGSGNPVSGASVTFQYLKPGGAVWATQTSTTGADGWAINSKSVVKNSVKGVYTLQITSVTKSGWTYDAGSNVVTSITFTVQ